MTTSRPEDPSPVLHYWSLSVEEQFYILWPAILIGLYAGLPGLASRGRRVAIGILGIGGISLIAAIWLTGVNQPWAFFLLPTRAWQLAVGGLIAVGLGRLSAIPPRLAATATVVGIASVLAAAFLFDDSTPFPGIAAILPVAGAALVILGGLPNEAPLPARVLALRPFRFLGRISYSLYLWHWPILLFGGMLLGPTMAIPLALLTFPVAAASQRWIEEPLRHGRFIGIKPRRNLLQAAGVGLAVVIASAAVTAIPAGPTSADAGGGGGVQAAPSAVIGTPGPVGSTPAEIGPQPCADCTVDDLSPPLDDLLTGRIGSGECDLQDMTHCVLGSSTPGAPVVALFGDSHAGNWTIVLSQLATDQGWRFVYLTHGGCPSVVTPTWNQKFRRAYAECDPWRERALARLEAEQPDLIIVANGEHYGLVDAAGGLVAYSDPLTEPWSQLWSDGLDKLLGQLTGIGGAVVVIGDGPVPNKAGLNPPECIARQQAAFRTCQAERSMAVRPAVHDLDRSIAASHGAVFVDPTPWMCGPEFCPAVIESFVVYSDGSGHLTMPFTLSLAAPLLAALPVPG